MECWIGGAKTRPFLCEEIAAFNMCLGCARGYKRKGFLVFRLRGYFSREFYHAEITFFIKNVGTNLDVKRTSRAAMKGSF